MAETVSPVPPGTREAGTIVMDEHVDEFCFALALGLRRILGIEPCDAEDDEDDEDDENEL